MKDMISVAPGFQYSVNIRYDLGSDDKLKNFIPTRSALDLLENVLLSVNPSSTNRARILIGAYGKGKSHIVLTILSLLLKRDLTLFEKLMPEVRKNTQLYQLIQNYYESDNKILPVAISGSSSNLTQAFLLSLQRTLSEHGLLDIMPETNYQAATAVIRRWEREFPATYRMFSDSIEEPVQEFIGRLENYDATAYEVFERIYPSLTSGSAFNPFLGFDAPELYESVAKSLKSKGFSGIYVVYDEFSKYLEANIVSASAIETRMLQEFAEKCSRSGKLQLHLMLISHKEISNYIDKLPKEKTDGWRGVSERFQHIHLNNNFSQTYEIISSVIQRNEPRWNDFCETHKSDFDAIFSRYRSHQMFRDVQENIEATIVGCFPLHPVSMFILPRMSERVAQNERTLFTFLSATGTATLESFLDHYNDDFSLVTPDLIFDYFEPLLRKEVYAGNVHDVFILTSAILDQISEGTLESRIVKTISLIYILEQFERLNPTKEQIIGIYAGMYSLEDIEKALSNLIGKELVVYFKRSNDYLRLKRTSGVDIRQKIHDVMELQADRVIAKEVLNASNFDAYMYPSRYNDAHEMTRYFAFQFITGSEANSTTDWDTIGRDINADGIIFAFIPSSEEELIQTRDVLTAASQGLNRFIFILPKHYRAIQDTVLEYNAVSQLKDNAVDNPTLFDEYEVVFDDLREILRDFIHSYTRPESHSSIYIHNGQILAIHRKSSLTELMSSICDRVYNLTPIINNEAINKSEITGIATNSRSKIISGVLRSELEPNLGLSRNGQDVSIMRSTLIRTGIWSETKTVREINLQPEDSNIRNMLSIIEKFILAARENGRMNFRTLYDWLMLPKYHIGLRLGVIPIYIAVVLHYYRQQAVIHDQLGVVPTTTDTLLQINANPENYTLEYLDWNPEKENYIKRLSEVFSDYVIDAEKSRNSYDYVANAMRRWFMALPKYSKESKTHPNGTKIAKRQQNMMKVLRSDVGGLELLFNELPGTFAYDEFTADVAGDIVNAKKVFDGLLDELKKHLISETRLAFLPEQDKQYRRKNSLIEVVNEWCDSLAPKSFEQLFPDGTDKFLHHLRSATNDEDLFITRLAKLATGLRLEDWNSKTSCVYFSEIQKFMATAKAFHNDAVAETINETGSYQVVFSDEDGEATVRRFDKIEVSAKGKLLFNRITDALDAMGHSLSEQEKRQVLIEILKKMC